MIGEQFYANCHDCDAEGAVGASHHGIVIVVARCSPCRQKLIHTLYRDVALDRLAETGRYVKASEHVLPLPTWKPEDIEHELDPEYWLHLHDESMT